MKDKIISLTFILVLLAFMLFGIVLPDKELSVSERRKLQQVPEFSFDDIFDGDYFNELNDYFVEQAPFRDIFRKIKGFVAGNIFMKYENNGVFVYDDTIYKLNSEINVDSVEHIVSLINNVIDNNIISDKIYYSIIPDKNYYLDDDSIPKLDYMKIEKMFENGINRGSYIDIFNSLDLNSYYKTDIHFRQENLEDVVRELSDSMNMDYYGIPSNRYEYDKFYGALYGQIASEINPDKLVYISNNVIDSAVVYDYEKNSYVNVYEEKHLSNIDSYDIFLSGARALIIIENKQQDNGRELVLFRDSFGSSLTPLLIGSYSKITMIDLRYLSSDMLDDIDVIDFNKEQDILFLYSIPIINDSFSLK